MNDDHVARLFERFGQQHDAFFGFLAGGDVTRDRDQRRDPRLFARTSDNFSPKCLATALVEAQLRARTASSRHTREEAAKLRTIGALARKLKEPAVAQKLITRVAGHPRHRVVDVDRSPARSAFGLIDAEPVIRVLYRAPKNPSIFAFAALVRDVP